MEKYADNYLRRKTIYEIPNVMSLIDSYNIVYQTRCRATVEQRALYLSAMLCVTPLTENGSFGYGGEDKLFPRISIWSRAADFDTFVKICSQLTVIYNRSTSLSLVVDQEPFIGVYDRIKDGIERLFASLTLSFPQTFDFPVNEITEGEEIEGFMDSPCYLIPLSFRDECEDAQIYKVRSTGYNDDLILRYYTDNKSNFHTVQMYQDHQRCGSIDGKNYMLCNRIVKYIDIPSMEELRTLCM